MLEISKIRWWSILAVCILSIFYSIYTFFPVDFFLIPKQRVNLGLDLQGGSHLLLKVDFDYYLKEQINILSSGLKQELRAKKVRLKGRMVVGDNVIKFNLRDAGDRRKTEKIIEDLQEDVKIEVRDQTQFTVYFAEGIQDKMKRKVLLQSMEIVRNRIDETGTKEPLIQSQGGDYIMVQVPGMSNPEELKEILGKTAKMTFHLVATPTDVEEGRSLLRLPSYRGQGEEYTLKREVVLSGDMLVNALSSYMNGDPVVNFKFNSVGSRKFAQLTQENIGRQLAVVLDGRVVTAPRINTAILGGSGVISGNFSPKEAEELAILLRAGSLPTPLQVIEERSVGASLGRDSILMGTISCVVGLLLVMAFMGIVYGKFGLFADVSLIFNLLLIIASMAIMGITLTMPGIAGIVLTMGMSVDANVLIYERIREALKNHKKIELAVEEGFEETANTIIDANITTLIIAFLLYLIGIGSIKGFAITLSIGLLASMFSAMVIGKLLVYAYYNYAQPKDLGKLSA